MCKSVNLFICVWIKRIPCLPSHMNCKHISYIIILFREWCGWMDSIFSFVILYFIHLLSRLLLNVPDQILNLWQWKYSRDMFRCAYVWREWRVLCGHYSSNHFLNKYKQFYPLGGHQRACLQLARKQSLSELLHWIIQQAQHVHMCMPHSPWSPSIFQLINWSCQNLSMFPMLLAVPHWQQ